MSSPAPAPAPERRKSRRLTVLAMSHLLRRAVDRAADAIVGAAAADVAGHRAIDVLVGRLRVGGEERRGRHDLSRLTVAALRDVLLHPSLLQAAAMLVGQPFDGGHRTAGGGGDRRLARADRPAVQMHGAGAALSHAATELGARQADRIAEDPEERGIGGDSYGLRPPIEEDGERRHGVRAPMRCLCLSVRAVCGQRYGFGRLGSLPRAAMSGRGTGFRLLGNTSYTRAPSRLSGGDGARPARSPEAVTMRRSSWLAIGLAAILGGIVAG